MAYFKITYKQGRTQQSKVIEADNRKKALLSFKTQEGGVISDIKEVSKPMTLKFRKKTNPIKNKRLNQEEYITFLDQFATMLDAGMPVNVCLDQCIKDTKNKNIKMVFANILSDIESGQSLTQSASKYTTQLTNLSVSLFNLGEQTGTLSTSVMQLSDILSKMHENRQKFKQATRYPLFIIVAMIIAFGVVITFVVPQFKQFFKEANMELPIPTKVLLWFENFLTNYGLYLIGISILIAFFIGFMYNTNYSWRHFMDKILLKVYIVGKVTYYAMIGRFTYLFQVLTDAGIPMLDAIDISKSVIDNTYIKGKLDMINSSIEDGKTLTQGFKDSGQFENMVIQMVNAGESTGSLGKMLSKANKVYNNKYDYIVKNISTLIEPVLITAIAGFVIVLALGIFLPMWSLVDLTN